MRYFKEYRHKFTDTPGLVIDAGKKLLGYLSNQKRLSGVDSLVQRLAVRDASNAVWIVEARFDKDIPSVRVIPPGGDEAACELYVESGLLDLGPNIASDAGDRFDRGLPVFSSAPATLYFGDGVDCEDGAFNGTVRVFRGSLASDCLPNRGNGIASRLTNPAKKQAQAALPASCWSGLMHRYVQAVYGGATLDYALVDGVLAVETIQIPLGTGLVEVAGVHLFVFAGAGPITLAPLSFVSDCGEAVYRAWQQSRGVLSAEQSNKMLTIALSHAIPGIAFAAGDAGDLSFASPYGWQFSIANPEGHVVAFDATQATLKKLTIAAAGDTYSASVTDVEVADLAPAAYPCYVSAPGASVIALASSDGLPFAASFDHPVLCYYDADALVVVRYTVQTPTLAVDLQEGWECTDLVLGTPTIGSVTWGTTAIADALNCSVQVMRQYGELAPPAGNTPYAFSMNKHAVVTGLFAKKASTTVWSTVRESDSLTAAFPADNGSDEGDRTNPTWLFSGALAVQMRTLNLGDAFTATVVHTEPAGNIEFTYCADLYVPGTTKCTLSGPNFLTYIGYDPGTDTECTSPVDLWSPILDPTNHNFTILSSSLSCTVPCQYVRAHQFAGDILLGPQNYLAIPAGDCAAMIPVNLKVSGTRLGEAATSDGYKIFTGRSCNDHYSGDCTGTITSSCDGYDPTVPGFTHAPHDEDTFDLTTPNIAFYKSARSNNDNPVIDPTWMDGDGPPVNSPFPVGDGSDATAPWIKDRLAIDWNSIVVSGGLVQTTDERLSEFEELISGTELPWESTEDPITCPTWHAIVYGEHTLDPLTVDGESGDTTVERMYLNARSTLIQRGFAYAFNRSLLNARVTWADALEFGASLNMDRQSITGGYSPVSTPSFVGWA